MSNVCVILEHQKLEYSLPATKCSFQKQLNVSLAPSSMIIHMLFSKFQRTVSLCDELIGNVGRQQTIIIPEYLATDSGIVEKELEKIRLQNCS